MNETKARGCYNDVVDQARRKKLKLEKLKKAKSGSAEEVEQPQPVEVGFLTVTAQDRRERKKRDFVARLNE